MFETDDSDDLIQKSAAAERARRIRAGVLHLVDLKRQKYSPLFTELVVDPRTDRITALPQRRAPPASKPRPFVETMLLRRRQQL